MLIVATPMSASDANCRQQRCVEWELMSMLYGFQEVLFPCSLVLVPVEGMHVGALVLLGVLLKYTSGFIST